MKNEKKIIDVLSSARVFYEKMLLDSVTASKSYFSGIIDGIEAAIDMIKKVYEDAKE